MSVLEKWVPILTQRQKYAWQPSCSAKQAGLYTIPITSSFRGTLIFFKRKLAVLLPVPLEVQGLRIASLHSVPCVLGGGQSVLSDESTSQSLGHRKNQWSHKPPTVQSGKTRLLQRRNCPHPLPPQLKGPLATGMKGRETE